MGYSNQKSQCPEWDQEMQDALKLREPHMERVVSQLSDQMPDKFICSRELFETALRHAFEGGVEACIHNITK